MFGACDGLVVGTFDGNADCDLKSALVGGDSICLVGIVDGNLLDGIKVIEGNFVIMVGFEVNWDCRGAIVGILERVDEGIAKGIREGIFVALLES